MPKSAALEIPFIISYWDGPPKEETTLDRYREIAECGFNVAMPAIEAETDWNNTSGGLGVAQNRKILDLCQQVGLKAMIWAGMPSEGDFRKPSPEQLPAIRTYLDDMMATFSAHPALLGYVLADEPGIPKFERLGIIHDYLSKKDPSHLHYINLFPNYASAEGLGTPDYEEHVARYIETVKPTLVSWDHYRQIFGDEGDESFYWKNLEIVRRQSLKAGLPYIQIICSLKHFGYRECSEADLRWQVYTSLAYGSRGILYYTYWDVASLAWAGAPAIMSLDGKRDIKYDYVKRINHRIARLGPTLLKVTSTGAYCTGPLPVGAQPLAPDAPIRNAEGGPMLIGCFADAGGTRYILPVNRSFKDDMTARLALDSRAVSVSEISQDTGEALAAQPLNRHVLDVRLQAGEGRLFRLNGPAS